jgi:ATP-binding cassette subfamily B protein
MNINVLQRGLSDCGPACLASVAACYGRTIPIAEIRQYANTQKTGTTIAGLISAAEKLGFSAKGVKGPFESIKHLAKPLIAHLKSTESANHFVTILIFTNWSIILVDPALGKTISMDHGEFKDRWTGVLLLLEPSVSFQQGDFKSINEQRNINLLTFVVMIAVIALLLYLMIRGL